MKRGMTLVEVLVACFLMALFCTMVAVAFAAAFRNYHAFEEKIVCYRNALNALDRMGRRLALCQQIYAPNWGNVPSTPPPAPTPLPTPYAVGTASPLVFGYYSSALDAVAIVGYSYSADTPGQIVEQDYAVYPGPPTSTTALATSVSSFIVTRANPQSYPVLVPQFTLTLPTGPPVTLSNQIAVQSLGQVLP
jgi:type II secretory pathway pseudopilin PulG